ncbi:hypothetical protein BDR22DRAFT_820729 [Usnea florida]
MFCQPKGYLLVTCVEELAQESAFGNMSSRTRRVIDRACSQDALAVLVVAYGHSGSMSAWLDHRVKGPRLAMMISAENLLVWGRHQIALRNRHLLIGGLHLLQFSGAEIGKNRGFKIYLNHSAIDKYPHLSNSSNIRRNALPMSIGKPHPWSSILLAFAAGTGLLQ